MILTAFIEDIPYEMVIPQEMLEEGGGFFSKMDADMDAGWQMGAEFVENPGPFERCQIAADKILGALGTENKTLALLMAAYIVTRLPDVAAVRIATDGEIQNTQFEGRAGFRAPTELSEEQLRARAEQDVAQVYKVGRNYRFAIRAPDGQWQESDALESEDEAMTRRAEVVAEKLNKLKARRIALD